MTSASHFAGQESWEGMWVRTHPFLFWAHVQVFSCTEKLFGCVAKNCMRSQNNLFTNSKYGLHSLAFWSYERSIGMALAWDRCVIWLAAPKHPIDWETLGMPIGIWNVKNEHHEMPLVLTCIWSPYLGGWKVKQSWGFWRCIHTTSCGIRTSPHVPKIKGVRNYLPTYIT